MITNGTEFVDTVIVGGGQAGLVMGNELARQGRDFVILDAGRRVGDAWRERWDSLELFTAARFDGLPGMPFPGDPLRFPTKDEVADFLEEYARAFGLPVRSRRARGCACGARAIDSSPRPAGCGGSRHNVVVATGGCQAPKVPEFAEPARCATSCSCTRASTATRRSCLRVPCSSSGWATPVRRSHGMSRPRTRP